MKFEHTEVWGFEHALRGMRNPMNSWSKSGTVGFVIGENDMKLAKSLIKAGSEHRKFLRQIFVSVDITATLCWFSEFDTYKGGNNCKQHQQNAQAECAFCGMRGRSCTEISSAEQNWNSQTKSKYTRAKKRQKQVSAGQNLGHHLWDYNSKGIIIQLEDNR